MKNPWRDDFPILERKVFGRDLVYLDNAATTQLPRQVLDRIIEHYTAEHANVHRGVHFLSSESTSAMEDARDKTAAFIGAPSSESIVFTQGTTDSIHLVCGGLQGRLTKRTEYWSLSWNTTPTMFHGSRHVWNAALRSACAPPGTASWTW